MFSDETSQPLAGTASTDRARRVALPVPNGIRGLRADPNPNGQTDSDGNEHHDAFQFNYLNPISVHRATPPSGALQGGTVVTVTGEQFPNTLNLQCEFGSIRVPARYISTVMVECTAPPFDGGSAGSLHVSEGMVGGAGGALGRFTAKGRAIGPYAATGSALGSFPYGTGSGTALGPIEATGSAIGPFQRNLVGTVAAGATSLQISADVAVEATGTAPLGSTTVSGLEVLGADNLGSIAVGQSVSGGTYTASTAHYNGQVGRVSVDLQQPTNVFTGQLVSGAGLAPGTKVLTASSGTMLTLDTPTLFPVDRNTTLTFETIAPGTTVAESVGAQGSTTLTISKPTMGTLTTAIVATDRLKFSDVAVGQALSGAGLALGTTITSAEGWSSAKGTVKVGLSLATTTTMPSATVLTVDPGTTTIRLGGANADIQLGQTVRGAGVPTGSTVRRTTCYLSHARAHTHHHPLTATPSPLPSNHLGTSNHVGRHRHERGPLASIVRTPSEHRAHVRTEHHHPLQP